MSEIEIGAPPETVWQELVKPDHRRRWYYDLQPEGDFRPGAEISWTNTDGTEAEHSIVREVVPPRRLVLETRFLFAPALASQAPHTLVFEVAPATRGSRVSMRVEAPPDGPVDRMFKAEGGSILKGLRLELDADAQAALERKQEIGEVEIHDVTPERLADYQDFFDNHGFADYPAWSSCYCSETNLSFPPEVHLARTADENRRDMSSLIAAGEVTALLAYVDGRPVAWCNYGVTTKLGGVMHRFGLDAGEYDGVGSVACFVISAPYRRHGLARRLLDAACQRLSARGLQWVEAYPPKDAKSPQGNYRGPLSMYLEAGFESHREGDRYLVVRKKL